MPTIETCPTPETPSPAVAQTVEIVFDAYDEILAANWLNEPAANRVIDGAITSTAMLAVELTLAHLRDVATPEELAMLASLRQKAKL